MTVGGGTGECSGGVGWIVWVDTGGRLALGLRGSGVRLEGLRKAN